MQDPNDTTVCEGDNASFTCVVFIPANSAIISPGWLRNGMNINMTLHDLMDNQTGGDPPIYIGFTVTVSNVRQFDDGARYQCGLFQLSNNATLNVVGKFIYCDLLFC